MCHALPVKSLRLLHGLACFKGQGLDFEANANDKLTWPRGAARNGRGADDYIDDVICCVLLK